MINFSIRTLTQNAMYAIVAAVTIVSMLFMGFFLAEPAISSAQLVDTSNSFYIRQTITDESAFIVEPTDVDMSGSFGGLTGGNATGTTQFAVKSNNSTGYTVEIAFTDNAGIYAMIGDTTASEAIHDFTDNAGAPIYGFAEGASAQFGYTVFSSSTNIADTADTFKYTGTTCSAGGGTEADGTCWKAPTTTSPYEIVNRGSAASTGATSTIQFKVNVPSGATPTPTADTYTSTATLTMYLQ